jgi:hypothetical protein
VHCLVLGLHMNVGLRMGLASSGIGRVQVVKYLVMDRHTLDPCYQLQPARTLKKVAQAGVSIAHDAHQAPGKVVSVGYLFH